VIKVQTDISRLLDQRTALRQRLDVVLRDVARLIGRPESGLALMPVSLELPNVEYDRKALEEESLQDHPSVRAARQVVEADQIWVKRKKLESRPDLRFGVGYVDVANRDDPAAALNPPQDNGQDIWSVSVGISLPIWRKRIRAGVAEAQENLQVNGRLLETTQDRLRYAIQESTLRLDSIDERSRLYHDVIIPQAEESLASAEAAYATDRQDFLDLLDAERVLFQVRLTYDRLRADYWIALADLEYGVGRQFPRQGSEG